jgi:hypothetical protein
MVIMQATKATKLPINSFQKCKTEARYILGIGQRAANAKT